jgi:hypothetical protein
MTQQKIAIMKRIYISGAISGLPRNEYIKSFANAEEKLVKRGYKVCNPTKLLPSKHLWIYHIIGYKLTLLYDIWHLLNCDGIYMIDGWQKSKGATIEKNIADVFGLEIIK